MSNHRCFELLRALAREHLPFVTVGSAALVLAHPDELPGYVLPDVDVIIAPDSVPALVRWAQRRGGVVTVWGEPWDAAVPLAGKHYVRVVIDGVQLDASFEEHDFVITELLAHARWCDGVPVCAPEPLHAMRRRKLAQRP